MSLFHTLPGILQQQAPAGGGSPPALRGTATTKAFSASYPISAPTGLATGDVVVLYIKHPSGTRTLSGFTEIATGSNSNGIYTILQGTMGGSPPSNFSPTGGSTDDDTICVALSGVDLANQVVGTALNDTAYAASPVIPGITVADNDSYLLAYFADNSGGNHPVAFTVTGTAVANVGTISLEGGVVASGATGGITVGPLSNQYTPHFGIAISFPPA